MVFRWCLDGDWVISVCSYRLCTISIRGFAQYLLCLSGHLASLTIHAHINFVLWGVGVDYRASK